MTRSNRGYFGERRGGRNRLVEDEDDGSGQYTSEEPTVSSEAESDRTEDGSARAPSLPDCLLDKGGRSLDSPRVEGAPRMEGDGRGPQG